MLSKFAHKFTVGFLKLLSTHPIHIVWGNFPFNHIWIKISYSTPYESYLQQPPPQKKTKKKRVACVKKEKNAVKSQNENFQKSQKLLT